MKLNLQANDNAEQRVKDYLEANASEELARKINEGVPVEKDGKPLVQKKTLQGFIRYATEEARKTAEKGASGAFVNDETVFGWAIHYFEEDSIEGELFNEDGTPYEKPRPKVETKPYTPPAPKPKEPTLFDLIEESEKKDESPETTEDVEEDVPEEEEAEQEDNAEPEETIQEQPQKQYSPFYLKYLDLQKNNQGAIIALRIGDFYEAFGEDAKTLAEAIGLTLTSRAISPDERVPMCGVPYHAMDIYFQKAADKGLCVLADSEQEYRLYRKDHKIAIVDLETGEYKEAGEEAPKTTKNDAVIERIVRLFKGQLEVML